MKRSLLEKPKLELMPKQKLLVLLPLKRMPHLRLSLQSLRRELLLLKLLMLRLKKMQLLRLLLRKLNVLLMRKLMQLLRLQDKKNWMHKEKREKKSMRKPSNWLLLRLQLLQQKRLSPRDKLLWRPQKKLRLMQSRLKLPPLWLLKKRNMMH